MDNKFKLRISRIFHNSCKSRDDVAPFHDVLEKAPFLFRSPSLPPAPRPLPRPSICKPRTPPSLHVNGTCIISSKEVRSFVPPRKARLKPKTPVARFSHFAYDPFYDHGGSRYSSVKDDPGKNRKKKSRRKVMLITDDRDFYSSDNEREDDDERTGGTPFSSRSLSSSESSENRRQMRTRNRASRRRVGLVDDVARVRGSLVVVKKSRDPYGDFRTSMVEMIIERQIFGEKELHQLLLCFLSLNSIHHHNIIVQVFKEIWDALFCM